MTAHTLQRPPDPGEAQKDEPPGGAGRYEGATNRDERREYAGTDDGTPVQPIADDLDRARRPVGCTLTKEEASVIAPAALAGVSVTPISDDRGRRVYIVAWRSLTKQCDTLAEVGELLGRMGVPT